MQRKLIKTAVIGVWLLACIILALWVDVSSASGWVLLVAAAVLPPIILLWFWHPPAQTMSESIHDVLK